MCNCPSCFAVDWNNMLFWAYYDNKYGYNFLTISTVADLAWIWKAREEA